MKETCAQCSLRLGSEEGVPSLLTAKRLLCGACAEAERREIRHQYERAKAAFDKADAMAKQLYQLALGEAKTAETETLDKAA
jgi:hypothetical protein